MIVMMVVSVLMFFFFSSRRRHTRLQGDWSSDVCSSDLVPQRVDVVHAELPAEFVHNLGETQLGVGIPVGQHRERRMPGQIGRASCRGKSVDLGGRRIIKKKKKNKKIITQLRKKK